MKYFIMAFIMILFVILYVWQNIEVMKLKMDYREDLREEKRLIKLNDRLKYEIERYKTIDVVEDYAVRNGMRKISVRDYDVIAGDRRK